MADAAVRTNKNGEAFVRTPEECFDNLPGYPWSSHYIEIDGWQQHFIDEGPILPPFDRRPS